jgi:D-lactate dehydrogenase
MFRSILCQEHYFELVLLAGNILLRNVIVTSYSAFHSREAIQRILDTTMENIQSFVLGNAQTVVMETSRRKAAMIVP